MSNPSAKTTNLVIGSDGFFGKPFCKYLEEKGEAVAHFDIKRNSLEDGRIHQFDFSNIDRIYFLAWDVGGAKYIYKKEIQIDQLDWNLKLLSNVMPQLQASGLPFLFVSSQLVNEYDTVYGVTKRLGEVWSRLIKGAHVRLWNVYGPIESLTERSHVVSDFVWQAVTKGEIHMMTTGDEKRQFVHIDDVCYAFYLAMAMQSENPFDISSFEWLSVYDLATIIAELTGADITRGKNTGSTLITPIIGKLPQWHPKVTINEGLSRMVTELAKRASPSSMKSLTES